MTIRSYTPEYITSLKANEVFVFGSNTQGRHGAGAARIARDRFGAIYGQARGLQGQSYAIVTTNLTTRRRYPLSSVYAEIKNFIEFATSRPDLTFYVTKIGCGLAGFEIDELKPLFKRAHLFLPIPDNVILPEEFECRDKTF